MSSKVSRTEDPTILEQIIRNTERVKCMFKLSDHRAPLAAPIASCTEAVCYPVLISEKAHYTRIGMSSDTFESITLAVLITGAFTPQVHTIGLINPGLSSVHRRGL